MNQQTINQIKESLTPLAEKLGQGAEFAYGVIYRQVVAEAIVTIVMLLVVGVVVFFGSKKWVKFAWSKHESAKDTYSSWDLATIMPTVLIVGVYLTAFFANFPTALLTVLNPHYYAIERILDIIKNGGQL